MSFYVIAFKDTKSSDVNHIEVIKRWIREDREVLALLHNGFTVYRTGNDQLAQQFADDLVWYDLKETKDEQS